MALTVSGTRPLYPDYGLYEGVPIARHYIDQWFRAHGHRIHGRVLEFGRPTYATGLNCQYDIIDIDPGNPLATLRADISGDWAAIDRPDHYDFVICTAVLQLVPDPQRAVENMRRMLKPGGALILAEKCISKIDSWSGEIDRWRFTPRGLGLLARSFARAEVSGHGNVYVICAYLMGLPAHAVESDKLAVDDPEYPLVAIAYAEK